MCKIPLGTDGDDNGTGNGFSFVARSVGDGNGDKESFFCVFSAKSHVC